ncbi:TauD/TfdA family dioxygenase [Streptomyces coeruleorubidus]|uniref:TauD/TfdA family dioxygenase n=1 Tax=Streptomyces coeruleorubidus TaxID=116188 RepID=UPI00369C3AEC
MSTLLLHDEESSEVGKLADEFLESHAVMQDPTELSAAAVVTAQRLPERVREFLARVRTEGPAVTVLSNLPVQEELEPTPIGWEIAAKLRAAQREEMVLLLCGAALGEPFGWVSQQAGRLIHDVCPTPEAETSLTSASSTLALNFHTEDVFHPCRCDYVSLFCLRNPTGVGTTVVPVTALDLPDEIRQVLFQERFLFLPDDSHSLSSLPDGTGGSDGAGGPDAADGALSSARRGAVLFGPADAPYLRFDIDFMRPVPGDREAAEAIEAVQRQLSTSAERVTLAPGDIVFLDNYRVVHGREAFASRYDGSDRWLKRLNLSRDARRIRALTGRQSVII